MAQHVEGVSINLYRFRDFAAVGVVGVGGRTVYLDAKAARKLARDAARLARSLEREGFLESGYETARVPVALVAS